MNILSEGLQAYFAYREQLHQCEKHLAEATLNLLKIYRPAGSRRGLGASESDLTREMAVGRRPGSSARGGAESETEIIESDLVLFTYEKAISQLEKLEVSSC